MAGKLVGRDPKTGRFIKLDSHELDSLAEDIRDARDRIDQTVSRVTQNACDRVVKAAQANVQRTAPIHNAGAWRYIDYDINEDAGDIWAEIGYNRKHAPARLGNLLEFGGGGDRSPAHWDLANALMVEKRSFEAAIVRAGGDVLLSSRWMGAGFSGTKKM